MVAVATLRCVLFVAILDRLLRNSGRVAAPEHPVVLAFLTAGFIRLVPIAAGLSIVRYQRRSG